MCGPFLRSSFALMKDNASDSRVISRSSNLPDSMRAAAHQAMFYGAWASSAASIIGSLYHLRGVGIIGVGIIAKTRTIDSLGRTFGVSLCSPAERTPLSLLWEELPKEDLEPYGKKPTPRRTSRQDFGDAIPTLPPPSTKIFSYPSTKY